MSINEMKGILKAYYKNSRSWSQKVDKMSEAQTLAIFRRWQNEGKV